MSSIMHIILDILFTCLMFDGKKMGSEIILLVVAARQHCPFRCYKLNR